MKKANKKNYNKNLDLAKKLLAKADEERKEFVDKLLEKFGLITGNEYEDTIIMDRMVTEEEEEYGDSLVSTFKIMGITVGGTRLEREIFPKLNIKFTSYFYDSEFEAVNLERDNFIKEVIEKQRELFRDAKEMEKHLKDLNSKFKHEQSERHCQA